MRSWLTSRPWASRRGAFVLCCGLPYPYGQPIFPLAQLIANIPWAPSKRAFQTQFKVSRTHSAVPSSAPDGRAALGLPEQAEPSS